MWTWKTWKAEMYASKSHGLCWVTAEYHLGFWIAKS